MPTPATRIPKLSSIGLYSKLLSSPITVTRSTSKDTKPATRSSKKLNRKKIEDSDDDSDFLPSAIKRVQKSKKKSSKVEAAVSKYFSDSTAALLSSLTKNPLFRPASMPKLNGLIEIRDDQDDQRNPQPLSATEAANDVAVIQDEHIEIELDDSETADDPESSAMFFNDGMI